MAGGKDQKQANQQIKEQGEFEKGARDSAHARNQTDLAESRARTSDVYSSLRGGYGNLAAGKANQPAGGAPSGGGGGGGPAAEPGPTGPDKFKETEEQYRNFAKEGGIEAERLRQNAGFYGGMRDSGGYDPQRLASLEGDIGGVRNVGNRLMNFGTGGINTSMDPAAMARMRGGGVYDEFAKTGGYSAQDQQNIRSRAGAAIPSTYARVRDEANRQASVSGGYGPGRAAMMGRLARDQSAGEAASRLNTEVGIKENVNAGRQWGAGGMTSSEAQLQAQLSDRERAGAGMQLDSLRGAGEAYGAAFGAGKGIADTQNANRFQAAGSMDVNERAAQEMRQKGMMFGTEGLSNRAESDRQADLQRQSMAQSASNASAAGDRWSQEFEFRKQMAGLEGLGSLYGSNPSEYEAAKQFDLQNREVSGGIRGDLGTRQKTGNKSWVDYAAPMAGAAAGFL